MADGAHPKKPLITRKLLHQALKQFHDSRLLNDHPLTGLNTVDAHRREAGYADTPSGRGLALRTVLREAILGLRPPGEEDQAERTWRMFTILADRYLQRRSPDAIADNLGIARSTYDHDHASALDAMAGGLQHAEDQQAAPHSASMPFLVPPLSPYPLVGRGSILTDLRQALVESSATSAIYGLPGIGKTALAVALAHTPELRDHYRDGILWAGLGQSPNLPGLLNTWGLAMGLRPQELGHLADLRERASALRALIGSRKMLLILDDVWAAHDSLALKIGGPECSTLITTRLPGIAIDLAGSFAFGLTELRPDDSVALLTEFIPEGLTTHPGAANSLHDSAGGLPLTLSLMGSYLRREYRIGSVRRFEQGLDLLREAQGRLQLAMPTSALDESPSVPLDTPRSLMGVIALSVDALEPAEQAALLALSVFPARPNTISETAALAVIDSPIAVLDALCDSGLLSLITPGRYAAHRAITELAAHRLSDNSDAEQAAASHMVQFYAEQATLHEFDDLDIENLLAALGLAGRFELSALFVRLLNAIYPLLEMRGLYAQARRHLEQASEAARNLDDPTAEIMVLNNRSRIALREGKYQEAEVLLRQGLELARAAGDDRSMKVLEAGLGVVALNRGGYDEARSLFENALTLARSVEDQSRIRALLVNLGSLALTRGDDPEAERLLSEALEAARAAGDRSGSSAVLANLGVLAARRHDFVGAETCFEESIKLANQVGNRESVSSLLTNLGALASDRDDETLASAYFDQALTLSREMGQQDRLCQLLANQGALAIRRGDLEAAQSYLEEGLAIAQAINHQEYTVLLHANFGALFEALGDKPAALTHLHDGLGLASKLGLARYVTAIQSQIETLNNE